MAGRILAGTASWADLEFIRDWYPKEVRANDRLAWYARRFPMVEVNATFHAIPDAVTTAAWDAQTPPDFVFTIKLYKGLSLHSVDVKLLPTEVRHLASGAEKRVEITPRLRSALIDCMRGSIEPIRKSGKLGGVLLQLSPEFRSKNHGLDELLPIVEGFADLGLAIELRNREWLTTDVAPSVAEWYEEHGVAFVNVDAPRAEHFTIMPPSELVTTDRMAYYRLHGRNAEAYIRGRTVADRFDYRYSLEEIAETAAIAKRMAEQSRFVFVVYNNNHSTYAVDAAGEFVTLVH